MAKRKPFKLKYGKRKELAKIAGVDTTTVWRAINYHSDTDKENQIRQLAKDLGFVRKF